MALSKITDSVFRIDCVFCVVYSKLFLFFVSQAHSVILVKVLGVKNYFLHF